MIDSLDCSVRLNSALFVCLQSDDSPGNDTVKQSSQRILEALFASKLVWLQLGCQTDFEILVDCRPKLWQMTKFPWLFHDHCCMTTLQFHFQESGHPITGQLPRITVISHYCAANSVKPLQIAESWFYTGQTPVLMSSQQWRNRL